MTSKNKTTKMKKTASTPASTTPLAPKKRAKRRQPSRHYTAQEKARAVLAIWTEKMSQSDIAREMEITYMTLQSWQKRAMEAMLQALENHGRLEDPASLSPRLRKLMDQQSTLPRRKLDQRLRDIQKGDTSSQM